MEYKVGVEGSYGCASFQVRSKLSIHITSCMMRVVVTNGTIVRIANIFDMVLYHFELFGHNQTFLKFRKISENQKIQEKKRIRGQKKNGCDA